MIDLNPLYNSDIDYIEIDNTYELPKDLIIDDGIKDLSKIKVIGGIS